jgi:hypothetical protein
MSSDEHSTLFLLLLCLGLCGRHLNWIARYIPIVQVLGVDYHFITYPDSRQ